LVVPHHCIDNTALPICGKVQENKVFQHVWQRNCLAFFSQMFGAALIEAGCMNKHVFVMQ